jgi:hypothetical protein
MGCQPSANRMGPEMRLRHRGVSEVYLIICASGLGMLSSMCGLSPATTLYTIHDAIQITSL